AGDGAGSDQGPNLPVTSDQPGGKWSRQKRENNAPNSLRRPEQRLAVGQWQTAVNRLGEPIAEPFLGEHRGPVGHDEEDQELKEQSRMHGAVLWPRKRPGPGLAKAHNSPPRPSNANPASNEPLPLNQGLAQFCPPDRSS